MLCPNEMEGDKIVRISKSGKIQYGLGYFTIVMTAMSRTLLFLTAWQYWSRLTLLSLKYSSLHFCSLLLHRSGRRGRAIPDFHYGSSMLSGDKVKPPNTVFYNSIPRPPFHLHQYYRVAGYIPGGRVQAPYYNY